MMPSLSISLWSHQQVTRVIAILVLGASLLPSLLKTVQAETPPPQSPLTVRSDIQEANSQTGVVIARGNVQIFYPSRKIQATAAQAQYFSRERRIILSGNVYVLQDGNSMRAETMTYLIDEGRFIATPENQQQVESIYLVTEKQEQSQSSPLAPAPAIAPTLETPPTLTPVTPPAVPPVTPPVTIPNNLDNIPLSPPLDTP